MKKDINEIIENSDANDLSTIVDRANNEIKKRKEATVSLIIEKITLQAEAHGLSLDEVCKAIYLRSKKTIPPLYRNPDNLSETWTGRGRTPQWVTKKLNEGFVKDDLRIHRDKK